MQYVCMGNQHRLHKFKKKNSLSNCMLNALIVYNNLVSHVI